MPLLKDTSVIRAESQYSLKVGSFWIVSLLHLVSDMTTCSGAVVSTFVFLYFSAIHELLLLLLLAVIIIIIIIIIVCLEYLNIRSISVIDSD
jgi:hypothetical protein